MYCTSEMFVFIMLMHMIFIDSRPCPYDSDFRCANGQCVRSNLVCNRYNNCRDGSDEINCSKYINIELRLHPTLPEISIFVLL